jgi:hypothetical protein
MTLSLRRATYSPLTLALILLTAASPALAWSNKEHLQFARLAAERLIADPATPPDMKAWLRRGIANPKDMAAEKAYFLNERIGLITRTEDPLAYWATMPDMVALTDQPSKKVEPWGVSERLLHYIDLEFFVPEEAKRSYAHNLAGRPKPGDVPDDVKDPRWARAGMLPFRVRECYGKLVESIRAGRLADEPGKYPRDEHAVKWAGYLAHYAADNTQPQHATVDYRSSAYFLDKRKAPNVHTEMEYRMCDDDADDYADLRAEFWPLFERYLTELKDPVETTEVFRATVEVACIAYEALPLIGTAAMAASKQGGTPEKPEGPVGQPFDTRAFFRFKGPYQGGQMTIMDMKAHHTAWAVKRIERLWLQAWAEARRPAGK